MIIACIILIVFAAGYLTQRGDICAVTAVVELVRRRRPERFAGFLLCAACSLLAISLGELLGRDVIGRQDGLPVSLSAALGGAAYGAGAFVNGRCIFGTVATLSSGQLPRLATLTAFFVGGAVVPPLPPPQAPVASILLSMQEGMTVLIATTLVIMLFWWLRNPTPDEPKSPHWPIVGAMAAFGLLIGSLAVLTQGWSYTPLFVDLTLGAEPHFRRHGTMALVFIGGGCAGALTARLFRPQRGPASLWARSACGGAIMGGGARMIPGGNDAMLFLGLPLLLPNMVLAYCTMNASLIALTIADRATSSGTR